ncbi:hypothetical protein ACIQXZ_28775 [Bacillus thuringiensis]|uniref:hypothetical protein n=1 Tax=Bacillus thuringiensis TaxID=1428 RepID=UPI003805B68D
MHKTPRFIVEIIKDMNRRIDHLSNLQEQDQQKLDTLKTEEGYARGLYQGYFNSQKSEIRYLQDTIQQLHTALKITSLNKC